jgi:hypothetical protein
MSAFPDSLARMSDDNKKEVPVVVSLLRLAVMSVALLLVVLAPSCSKPQDVTSDPRYGNFTAAVSTWKTKVPLTLREQDKRLYLLGTNTFMPRARELSAVPVGTEIRIERLILRPSWECDVTEATGSLVTGPHAGKSLILDPVFFPRPGPGKRDWTVVPEQLEPLTPASGVTR